MSQSQNQSLEPKSQHRRRNKVYTIPIVAIPIKTIILENPSAPRLYNEKLHNSMTNKNNKETALYNENAINATLCNIHAIFMFVSPGQDECFLNRNLPDKIVLLVSSRIITARDINRCISNTMTCDHTFMSHILSISATVSSEIGVNLLPESVELLSNIMHKLFYDLKQPMIAKAHRVKQSKYSHKIETTMFTRFKNLEYTHKLIKTTPKITVYRNTPSTAANRSSIGLCKYFKTYFVEGRRMSYKTLTCKFSSFSVEILMKLVAILYSSGIVKTKSNMPSLCQRNWYVRNVAQGYLLTVLLKKINIAPLNLIRKPYFVIITSETYPIKYVEFNFKLGNGIAMAFNTRVFGKWSFDFTQWNVEHKRILDKSISFSFCIYKPRDKRAMPTDADTIECKINSSYYGSNTTLKIDPTDEKDNETDMKNIFFTESELFDIKSSSGSEIQVNDSVRKLHIGEVASEKCVFSLRRTRGNMNFRPRTSRVPSDMHDAIVKLAKACFFKLFDKSQTIKAFFGIPHMNCDRLINETIFDSIVINEYIKTISHSLVQFKLQVYCSVLNIFHTACSA